MKLKKIRKSKQFESKMVFCPACDDGTTMWYYKKFLKSPFNEKTASLWGWHCTSCDESIFHCASNKHNVENVTVYMSGWYVKSSGA